MFFNVLFPWPLLHAPQLNTFWRHAETPDDARPALEMARDALFILHVLVRHFRSDGGLGHEPGLPGSPRDFEPRVGVLQHQAASTVQQGPVVSFYSCAVGPEEGQDTWVRTCHAYGPHRLREEAARDLQKAILILLSVVKPLLYSTQTIGGHLTLSET